jgi:trehalose 6-phosphate synthase
MGEQLRMRFADFPAEAFHRYYHSFSNPILWFLQHSIWDLLEREYRRAEIENAWHHGYIPVNRAFAKAVVKEVQQGDTAPYILIHDYHLYLAALFVRQYLPRAIILHFTHIPWPSPGVGCELLGSIWQQILAGLLANDIAGFQTRQYALNFLQDCEASLPGARVNYDTWEIAYRGRKVLVRAYPISVDVDGLRAAITSPEVQEYKRRILPLCGERTIVKVDRVDPSKNIATDLRAFRRFLEDHPELSGKVRLLAFLVPSRTSVPEYRRYSQEVMSLVRSINAQFACDGWQPIQVFYENNYYQALAGMSLYDVLMVNPLADGMNLVSKEGPIVNQRDGVLVLSEAAGSHAQLGGAVLSVKPTEVEEVANALRRALSMTEAERSLRAEKLRRAIEAEDLTRWLYGQFHDINMLVRGGHRYCHRALAGGYRLAF